MNKIKGGITMSITFLAHRALQLSSSFNSQGWDLSINHPSNERMTLLSLWKPPKFPRVTISTTSSWWLKPVPPDPCTCLYASVLRSATGRNIDQNFSCGERGGGGVR